MKKEFWIINISTRNVSLADLNITINSFNSVNLLSKHYHLTLEQIESSVKSGSIFKKRDKIKIKGKAPIKEIAKPILEDKNGVLPNTRTKSIVMTKHEHYEELELSDEQFAEENADLNE